MNLSNGLSVYNWSPRLYIWMRYLLCTFQGFAETVTCQMDNWMYTDIHVSFLTWIHSCDHTPSWRWPGLADWSTPAGEVKGWFCAAGHSQGSLRLSCPPWGGEQQHRTWSQRGIGRHSPPTEPPEEKKQEPGFMTKLATLLAFSLWAGEQLRGPTAARPCLKVTSAMIADWIRCSGLHQPLCKTGGFFFWLPCLWSRWGKSWG